MKMQNYLKPIFSMGLLFLSVMSVADNTDKLSSEDTIRNTSTVGKGFVLSGYGEVVMTRNFYSDYIYRYSRPDFVIASPKNLRQRVWRFSDVLPSALFGCKPLCSEVA